MLFPARASAEPTDGAHLWNLNPGWTSRRRGPAGNLLGKPVNNGRKTRQTAEFGDFQTPESLARQVCALLARTGCRPASIVEPTCGLGAFLIAALQQYPDVERAVGLEINPRYVQSARAALRRRGLAGKTKVLQKDFFQADWHKLLGDLPRPTLVIGNPPWVTNAGVSVLGGANLPEKSNFQNHSGFDAITGKSNFDISEWMLIKLADQLDGHSATIAMLCKTVVARKLLTHVWKHGLTVARAELRSIDSMRHFGAAVDACLLMCTFEPSSHASQADVYARLNDDRPTHSLGYRDGQLLADLAAYDRWKHLQGPSPYRWRSGIKHDRSKVMELYREGGMYRNGMGELVELEDTYLYPMLKGSELANGKTKRPTRWMLVTQKQIGDPTAGIRDDAPKTWRYLVEHGELLDSRGSSIYRKRPRFSVFGVGDYSFSRWKVAISGLYKRLQFTAVGRFEGKPIVLDDTANFIPCRTKREAEALQRLLNSEVCREFYSAFIFWDSKRPITVDVLQRLNLLALAEELGVQDDCLLAGPQKTLF